MTGLISCAGLTKDYGSGHGLFDANLEVMPGEIFGLIGPNGAGKSTLIRMLTGLVQPDAGTAKIFGLETKNNYAQINRRLGFVPGEQMQFPGVTAGYILKLLLNMRGIENHQFMFELAERFSLDLKKKYQNLSHGNKQKVALVQAFMHQPELVILDEPAIGLDPLMQKELRSLILEYQKQGKTVVLSSHVLSEVENVCGRVALINNGRIIRQDTLSALRGKRIHKFEVLVESEAVLNELRLSLSQAGAESVEIMDLRVLFNLHGSVKQVLKVLAGFPVIEIDSRELSLEEVFFAEVKDSD